MITALFTLSAAAFAQSTLVPVQNHYHEVFRYIGMSEESSTALTREFMTIAEEDRMKLLLEKLPMSYRRGFFPIKRSGSIQLASPDRPRIILRNGTDENSGNVMLSFNHGTLAKEISGLEKEQITGDQELEVMIKDSDVGYRFYSILPGPPFQVIRHKETCTECHRGKSAIGIASHPDATGWDIPSAEALAKTAKKDSRYGFLDWDWFIDEVKANSPVKDMQEVKGRNDRAMVDSGPGGSYNLAIKIADPTAYKSAKPKNSEDSQRSPAQKSAR